MRYPSRYPCIQEVPYLRCALPPSEPGRLLEPLKTQLPVRRGWQCLSAPLAIAVISAVAGVSEKMKGHGCIQAVSCRHLSPGLYLLCHVELDELYMWCGMAPRKTGSVIKYQRRCAEGLTGHGDLTRRTRRFVCTCGRITHREE